jgi:hypothetical protein
MDIVRIVIAALIFPGLLTVLALGVVLRVLRGRGAALPRGLAGNREALAALTSSLFAGAGLALMPWPEHPAGATTTWLGAWVVFELAFLLPIVPALFAGAPNVVRAAVRTVQLGVAARALLWAILAAMLSDPLAWSPATLPLRLLALVAALAALLPGVGWGIFGNEPYITPDGVAAGLPTTTQLLLDVAQDVRAAALLAAVLVVALPTQVGASWLGLIQVLAGFIVVVLVLRRFEGYLPRLTLRTALRYCWIVVAPLAAGVVLGAAWQL